MTDAHEALQRRADGTARDVASIVQDTDHLREQYDGDSDIAYDLYVEELRFDDGRKTVGVIDMGDLYQGVFEWDGKEWHDALHLGTPPDILERILKAREFNSRF